MKAARGMLRGDTTQRVAGSRSSYVAHIHVDTQETNDEQAGDREQQGVEASIHHISSERYLDLFRPK